jgi:signal transduction histidine kinase
MAIEYAGASGPRRIMVVQAPETRLELSYALKLVAGFVAVCGLAMLAIVLTQVIGTIAAMWAAGGVAFAVWAAARPDPWSDLCHAALFGSAFTIANLLVGNGVVHIALYATADILEVALAVLLVRRLCGAKLGLRTVAGMTRFIAACFLAPLAPASAVAGVMALEGGGAFIDVFTTWWLGHGLGFAVVAPFLISLGSVLPKLKTREGWVFLAGLAAFTAFLLWAFSRGPGAAVYLIYPPLLAITLRFRLFGAALAGLIVAVTHFCFSTSWIAAGLISPGDAVPAMRDFQMFAVCLCLPALVVAAVLDERDIMGRLASRQQARAEAVARDRARLMENVSHEMRTPLNSLVSLGEILESGQAGALGATQSALVGTMVGGARRLHLLADHLTSVAAAESGEVAVTATRVDLNRVATSVCESLKARATAQGARLKVVGAGKVEVIADPVLLGQILEGLVTNAIKFAGAAGPITVQARRDGQGIARIEVRDAGPGVRAQHHDAVFEPFNRLAKSTCHPEGAGVGLAVARKLAELQGGRLDYESRQGEGACFWLELPAAA